MATPGQHLATRWSQSPTISDPSLAGPRGTWAAFSALRGIVLSPALPPPSSFPLVPGNALNSHKHAYVSINWWLIDDLTLLWTICATEHASASFNSLEDQDGILPGCTTTWLSDIGDSRVLSRSCFKLFFRASDSRAHHRHACSRVG